MIPIAVVINGILNSAAIVFLALAIRKLAPAPVGKPPPAEPETYREAPALPPEPFRSGQWREPAQPEWPGWIVVLALVGLAGAGGYYLMTRNGVH
jgi:hypothetical protein